MSLVTQVRLQCFLIDGITTSREASCRPVYRLERRPAPLPLPAPVSPRKRNRCSHDNHGCGCGRSCYAHARYSLSHPMHRLSWYTSPSRPHEPRTVIIGTVGHWLRYSIFDIWYCQGFKNGQHTVRKRDAVRSRRSGDTSYLNRPVCSASYECFCLCDLFPRFMPHDSEPDTPHAGQAADAVAAPGNMSRLDRSMTPRCSSFSSVTYPCRGFARALRFCFIRRIMVAAGSETSSPRFSKPA